MKKQMLLGIFGILFFVSSAKATIVFSQFAIGGVNENMLLINNPNASNRTVVVTLQIDPSVPTSNYLTMSVSWNITGPTLSFICYLNAQQCTVGPITVGPFTTWKLRFTGGANLLTGALMLDGIDDGVVSSFYNYLHNGEIVSMIGSGPCQTAKSFVFTVEKSSSGTNTGLAWFIGTNQSVRETLYDQNGIKIISQVNSENSYRALFFDQLFSSAQISSNFIGSVRLDFTTNASLMVLRSQSNSDGTFFMTSTPPQIIP